MAIFHLSSSHFSFFSHANWTHFQCESEKCNQIQASYIQINKNKFLFSDECKKKGMKNYYHWTWDKLKPINLFHRLLNTDECVEAATWMVICLLFEKASAFHELKIKEICEWREIILNIMIAIIFIICFSWFTACAIYFSQIFLMCRLHQKEIKFPCF